MSQPIPREARRNVLVLIAAQAILGAQITMIFTIGGLAGQMLAPNICFATLPISLIILGSTTTAPWLSAVMQKWGRRIGFWIGAMGGLVGAAISAFALMKGNFWLFLLGSYFTGIYQSSQGFFRFAATDLAPDHFKPKAISYVLAGGLISALIGPQLVKITSDHYAIPFLGSYMVAMGLNLIGMLLFFRLTEAPRQSAPAADQAKSHAKPRPYLALLADPVIRVAIICAMVSYALMNLVMTSTPLAVVGCGFDQGDASNIVTAHVIAMFLPSFFTGHVIARIGTTWTISIGLVILAAAGGVALIGVDLSHFFIALILLGLGWNFGFIGATAMLTAASQPHERGRIQGMNDAIVFGAVTLASLASGGLLNCSGNSIEQGWTLVNLAMMPLLVLAGVALIWLHMRPREV